MPLLTPYVALLSTEVATLQSELEIEDSPNGYRLAYKSTRPGDRDKHGNLWARMEETPGPSKVLYHSMHPRRQRECMEHMLCQVCREPADRNRQGWLFIDWQRVESPPTWPERSLTSMPPVCAEHARVSARQCPHLRHGPYVVLRARKAPLYGVAGIVYRLTLNGWVTTEDDVLSAYSKKRLPGMLASRLFRELRGVTVVDLP
ncbi:hypothetical protein [Streptomyces paludis]|uniref:Uncharacterized protein n=1 Tax=Streptomyces paludis TaxID=2282738 RepID=A0A345HNJ4_9ACTN|nr:hypothetical protein [Streptomyces paludis]AXG78268.1 hypothetical protein DVK44_11755 [Streptomyces paludis]